MTEIDDDVLQDLYGWIDQIPLSRPKRSIARDFSDGVLMAEVVKHYCPKLVDLHNFSACNATDQKKKNWLLLNWKIFKKLSFELSPDVIDALANAKPGTIERVLLLLRTKLDKSLFQQQRPASNDAPEVDQDQAILGASSRRKSQQPQQKVSPRFARGKAAGHGRPVGRSDSLQRVGQTDFVTRLEYEEKVQESLAKSETIDILEAKIRRLEHLLHLKDVRIDELQTRLGELRPTGSQQQQQYSDSNVKRVAIPKAM
ncbi:hypothetical protein BOX15_Mlig008675g3 [Macrostomum lignano]|uniref:Uncharacterized protein n=2 Tax=Macrostomum lignano TaxID=282301 RepID=A0A267EIU7_9PLAT|nr:hypothetical protein BOX15_Mlig008675g2 [Macrostomum lignano]PAA85823.1 hypothetical protein BOX15_Mlig008675g3 [Macrostomum lignano]